MQMLNQAMEMTFPHHEHLLIAEIPPLVAKAVVVANELYKAVEERWPGVPRCSCPPSDEED